MSNDVESYAAIVAGWSIEASLVDPEDNLLGWLADEIAREHSLAFRVFEDWPREAGDPLVTGVVGVEVLRAKPGAPPEAVSPDLGRQTIATLRDLRNDIWSRIVACFEFPPGESFGLWLAATESVDARVAWGTPRVRGDGDDELWTGTPTLRPAPTDPGVVAEQYSDTLLGFDFLGEAQLEEGTSGVPHIFAWQSLRGGRWNHLGELADTLARLRRDVGTSGFAGLAPDTPLHTVVEKLGPPMGAFLDDPGLRHLRYGGTFANGTLEVRFYAVANDMAGQVPPWICVVVGCSDSDAMRERVFDALRRHLESVFGSPASVAYETVWHAAGPVRSAVLRRAGADVEVMLRNAPYP